MTFADVFCSYWLFPVVVAAPQSVCDGMKALGYDVTQGATQLGSVDKYVTDKASIPAELDPIVCRTMMQG